MAQALERLVDQPWKTDGLQLGHEHLETKSDQLDAGGKNTVRIVRRAIPVRPKGTGSAPTPSESESGPVREALNLLAADIIRDPKGVIGVPARHEVAALHAMVVLKSLVWHFLPAAPPAPRPPGAAPPV